MFVRDAAIAVGDDLAESSYATTDYLTVNEKNVYEYFIAPQAPPLLIFDHFLF